MKPIAKTVVFTGRVQGVGFRFTTYRLAENFKVTGYVKNLPTGQVELFVQGAASEVDGLIERICDYFGGYIREKIISRSPISPSCSHFEIAF